MNRKDFLRNTLLGSALLSGSGLVASAIKKNWNKIQENEILGFNHLPTPKTKKMENSVLHKANTRGHANHGWLDAHHSFSFASYYNPDRMQFGALRVLNDDMVSEGQGFGTHPHDNMEIITIPLEGAIEHKDSMGNSSVIRAGEIQVMSAGSGITHSEFNHFSDKKLKLLQIWIFPNKQNVKPRYDQLKLDPADKQNRLQQILSPVAEEAGVWIYQNAWFHLGKFDKDMIANYQLKDKANGVYAFVIKGEFIVNDQKLETRDALGVWSIEKLSLSSLQPDSEILLIEVPMNV
jgi:redox-sensitive bicupin YhaK (pirin superfamily)